MVKKKSKEDLISEEFERISKLYDELPKNQFELIRPMIQNFAFLKVELDEMQAIIISDGVTEEYKHGEGQYGKKASSTIQAYNTTLKQYTVISKKLCDMLPNERKKSKLDSFNKM